MYKKDQTMRNPGPLTNSEPLGIPSFLRPLVKRAGEATSQHLPGEKQCLKLSTLLHSVSSTKNNDSKYLKRNCLVVTTFLGAAGGGGNLGPDNSFNL